MTPGRIRTGGLLIRCTCSALMPDPPHRGNWGDWRCPHCGQPWCQDCGAPVDENTGQCSAYEDDKESGWLL